MLLDFGNFRILAHLPFHFQDCKKIPSGHERRKVFQEIVRNK